MTFQKFMHKFMVVILCLYALTISVLILFATPPITLELSWGSLGTLLLKLFGAIILVGTLSILRRTFGLYK